MAHATLPVLDVRDLDIVYDGSDGPVQAIKDLSFTVEQGEFFVILGPSGGGKSTLLKAIAGLLEPRSGSILVNGHPVGDPGPDRMVVFQEFDQLFPWKTVKQNVEYGLRVTGHDGTSAATASEFLTLVGLGEFQRAYPHTLSGGMKQRAAIARALAIAPDVLLMDEPFGSLDAQTRLTMQLELAALWKRSRKTVIFVTHSIEEAIILGTTILVLTSRPGRVKRIIRNPYAGPEALEQAGSVELRREISALLATADELAELVALPETPGDLAERVAPPETPTATEEVRPAAPAGPRSLGWYWSQPLAYRARVVLAVLLLWEVGTRLSGINPVVLPPASAVLAALASGIADLSLFAYAARSLQVLMAGLVVGTILALVMTSFAVTFKTGRYTMETLTAMLNPVPGIALLPLALVWFGLGQNALIFVVVHSSIWVLSLNIYTGFATANRTVVMVGKVLGLRAWRLTRDVLLPSAFPNILTGLKVAWAYSWRTVIAAELVFGAIGGQGGLGWYIYQSKTYLDTAGALAGILMIVLIGLVVENVLFQQIERVTVRRWGVST